MSDYKVKDVRAGRSSAFRKYRDVTYGDVGLGRVIWFELLTALLGGLPGAVGLFLRSKLYRPVFRSVGRGLVIGRNVTLRHAHKIDLGDNVVLDDNSVVDAKGDTNRGIEIGDDVYLGRNTIVYCKNGDIRLGRGVNISSNCQLFSSNDLAVGPGCVIAAYSYFLSGGEYDPSDPTPFARQSGTLSRGKTVIGADCWIGAGVKVLDGSRIGDRCVLGAGAVVIGEIPPRSLAVGVPARPVKSLETPPAPA